jgi:hypothetical protein
MMLTLQSIFMMFSTGEGFRMKILSYYREGGVKSGLALISKSQ